MAAKTSDKNFLLAVIAALLFLAFVLALPPENRQQKISVVLGDVDTGNFISYGLLNNKTKGPDMDVMVVPTPKNNELLVSGDADIGTTSLNDFALLKEKGADYEIIAIYVQARESGGASFSRLMTGKNSSIKTMKDLAGKNIGVYNRISPETVAFLALARDKYAMNISDTNIILKPPATLPQLLDRGDVDAILVPIPLNLNLNALGYKTLLDVGSEYREFYRQPLPIAVFAAKKELLQSNRPLVSESLKALRDSYQWGLSNMDEVLSQKPEGQKGALKDAFSKYISILMPIGGAEKNAISKVWELSKSFNAIQTIPDVDSLISNV